MTELLTAAQMRAIETAAIESGDVTGLELMERAGRGVVEAVFEEWPELAATAHRAVVLCGPGNNGGDGFVVARLLKEWGWEVEVFLYGDPKRLPPDARVNYERWSELGGVTALSSKVFEERSLGLNSAIIVDALFGTGLSRSIELPLAALPPTPEAGATHRLVSVDMPSGLCADSGRQILGGTIGHGGIAAPSDLTVTFHSPKIGHLLAEGPKDCGKSIVKSIGLEDTPRPQVGEKPPTSNHRFASGKTGAVRGRPALPPGEAVRLVGPPFFQLSKGSGHKFSHGHALVLTGGAGRTGAARLSARGALRIGAGLVTLGVPGNAQMEVAGQITALMLTRVEDGDGLADVLQDPRINALCLGPGMGIARAAALLPAALEHTRPGPRAGASGGEPRRGVPGQARDGGCVVDADALTALAENPETMKLLHDRCVLTPHGGEFARLFPDIAEKLNAEPLKGPAYSRVDATREAAQRAGCTIVFKGPDTVIAAPDGRCSINSAHYERSAPWLATAGSGDVLAGFITGLLARGFAPMQAAETAAWLHVECARSFGPGLISEDLPEELPKVFRELGV